MVIRYHHTQRGVLMLVVLTIAAVLSGSAAYLNPASSERWPLFVIAIGSAVLAWLFSSLTADVNEKEFHWYFGPGIWSYRIALTEIDSVKIVRNTWSNGFGIRMRPGFRLYNVSGLDAVELRLKTGEIRRIGTDDTQGLVAALKS
ncbi:MAG: hypothetical protein ACRECA_14000 [Pseudolabrys sp.]